MHQMIQSTYHGVYRQRRLTSRDLPSMRAGHFGMLQETTNQLWRISPEQGETLLSRAFLSTTGRLLRAGKLQLDTSQTEASSSNGASMKLR